MEFKDRLKNLRLNKGLSQVELAKELGVSHASIGMYEAGQRVPRDNIRELIADYFNVDTNYLMGFDRTLFYVDPTTMSAQGLLAKNPKLTEVVFACEGLSDKEIDFILSQIEGIKIYKPIKP